MEKMFIKKEKWSIKFVPYTKGEMGIAVKFNVPTTVNKESGWISQEFTLEEFRQFGYDMTKAVLHRYDVEFPNDVKPKKPREQLVKEMIEHVSKRGLKQQYIV